MEKIVAKPLLKLPLVYAGAMLLLTLFFFMQAAGISGADATVFSVDWVPSLNIALAFRLDGLSLIFAIMISFIGTLIFIYSAAYMRGYTNHSRFIHILFTFALSMLGLVLADNVIMLFFFWELTSITSYLLIGTHHHLEISRKNALQALLVTSGGGLAMFAGLVWMGVEVGSFSLSEIIAAPEYLLTSSYVTPILICILLGCFTKSAQWPYSFWLPNAMAAPTPVSAYLHSATMVKAGIYLLARLQPVFSFHEYWTPVLAGFGLFTALYGSLLCLKQQDLKLMLAYSTLMALGTLTFLLAFPSRHMAVAAMAFMVAHALYKASLFMLAGMIDKYTGTRKRTELSGLRHFLPELRYISIAAALSMAGIPLLFGFIAKEAMYQAVLNLNEGAYFFLALLVVINACMVALAFVFAFRLFHGEVKAFKKEQPKAEFIFYAPAAIAAYCGIGLALFPQVASIWLVDNAASAMIGFSTSVPLELWHGLTEALAWSGATLLLGTLIIWRYSLAERLISACAPKKITVENFYFKKLEFMDALSTKLALLLHPSSLRFYMRATLLTISATILTAAYATKAYQNLFPTLPQLPDWISIAICIMTIFGALIAARAESKVMALAALGASGFALAGIFMLHGALDVAMTQFLVETLVVVLATAVLWRIPDFRHSRAWDDKKNYVNMLVAASMAVALYIVLTTVLSHVLDLSITAFYENASLTLAHGRNIVNVILVDFRAFDTLGETSVVAIAAIGVWGMMRALTADSKKQDAV